MTPSIAFAMANGGNQSDWQERVRSFVESARKHRLKLPHGGNRMMLVFRFEESSVSELEKLRNRLRANEKAAQEKRERLESERKRNRLRKQGRIIPY